MINYISNWSGAHSTMFSLGFGDSGSFLFILLLIWMLYWKGMALWRVARAGSRSWFVVLLVLQTLGILDILYLYVFSKKKAAVVK